MSNNLFCSGKMDVEVTNAIDEATIKAVMEDVGLKASDLNSDSSSETVDGEDSGKSKNSSQDSSRRRNTVEMISKGKFPEDFQPELEGNDSVPNKNPNSEGLDENSEETAAVLDSEGENDQLKTPSRKDNDKINPEKNPLEEMQDDNVFVDTDKDRNEDEIDK